MVGFEFTNVKGRYIDACVNQTNGNVVPSIMVWGAFHFGGKSELVIVEGPHEPARLPTGLPKKSLALGKGHLSQ